MTNILALIRNPDLSTDEAIVASIECFRHDYGDNIEFWNHKVEPFQTSKSLTDLKKQFEAKEYVVHLHWKEVEVEFFCQSCNKLHKEGEEGCAVVVKLLMLAVFAPEDIVKEMV